MPRWFFPSTGGRTYREDGTHLASEPNYAQGQSTFAPDGNLRSLVVFDTASVRDVLSSQLITACYLDFSVSSTYFPGGATVVVGTHNYTSVPAVWEDNRVNQDRLRRGVAPGETVTNFSLGTTIGNELRNGVSTGVALGPAPSSDYDYAMSIAPDGSASEPVLVVDTVSVNQPPYAPILTGPISGDVIDAANQGITFSWIHRDPNQNVQTAYALARAVPGSPTAYWWNATTQTWQAGVEVFNTSSSQSVTLTPAQWGVSTPAGPYIWTVATRDFELTGPYVPNRTFYASTPPVTDITEPGATVATSRPTVKWNYSDVDGQPQFGWLAQVVEQSVFSQPGFDPNNNPSYLWYRTALNAARSVASPVDLKNHKIYRVYVVTVSSPNPPVRYQYSNYDFVEFQVVIAPFAPTLAYPQNGSIVDLNAGFTLTWTNNHYDNDGAQSALAIRRRNSTGTDHWWSGSAWVTIETFLPGTASAYAFRPAEVPNGQTFTFSVRIRDAYGLTSPYSSGATVLGSTAAQVTVFSPPPTVVTTNPQISWSVYDAENDPQQTYHVRVIAASVYDAGIPDPGTATAVWDTGEVASSSVRSAQVIPDLANTSTYRAYVRVKTGGVYSGWSYAEFTVAITPPAQPSAVATPLPDAGAVEVVIQGRDSLLTPDASRGAGGWSSLANCTVQTAVSYVSAESDLITNLTASATGNMSAHTTDLVPVVPNETYTGAGTAIVGPGDVAVEAYVSIEFYDVDDAEILVSSGNVVVDASALRSSVTAEAPSDAAQARLRVTFRSVVAAGDVHGLFDPVLRPGTGDEWSPGGVVGTTTVSIIEANDGRIVRRGLNVPVPDSTQRVVIRDEEVPAGRPLRYEIVTRAVYEELVLISPTLTLAEVTWTSGWLWLSDPLVPGSGRSYAPQSFGAVTRPVRQGKFRPIGRPDAVITTGVRGLREGTFTIVAHDRETRERFLEFVNSTEVVLLRVPPDTADPAVADPLGETIYVRLEGDAPEERPLPSRTPHRIIVQAWTEQVRPLEDLEFTRPPEGIE